MSGPVMPIDEDELHALVDDQLAPQRRAEVEAFVESDPEAAARVTAWREQKRRIKALFDPVLDEPLPRLVVPVPTRRAVATRFGGWRHAAMALLYLAAGATGGYLAAPGPVGISALADPDGLVRQAALAHAVYTPEVVHPVEVGAEQQAHLVKWLSKRLQHPLTVPDLSGQGMHLVGGRLLPGARGPAAQFMYENASGRRLTLFVRSDLQAGRESAFRFGHSDGVGVFYWIDDRLGYALSGEMPRARLLELATAIHAQVDPRP